MSGALHVLVACEFSDTVRSAFEARGHDAWSCDLLPSEGGKRRHLQCDALDAILSEIDHGVMPGAKVPVLRRKWLESGPDFRSPPWDMLIAHPPCTYLANSGAKHLYRGMRKENGPAPVRWEKMREAAKFYVALLAAPVARIAVENPIMHGPGRAEVERLWARLDRGPLPPVHYVQPHEHGHGETKATGFRLIGLDPLVPSNRVAGREQRVWKMGPSPDRWKDRSRTFPGIAAAMADQWGGATLSISSGGGRGAGHYEDASA